MSCFLCLSGFCRWFSFEKKVQNKIKAGDKKDKRRTNLAAGWVGLKNLGNTCYINSVMQALISNEMLVKKLASSQYKNRAVKGIFSQRIICLYDQFQETQKQFINPSQTLLAVSSKLDRYRIGNQEDAHEFLMDYLEQINEETHIGKNTSSRRITRSRKISNLRDVVKESFGDAVEKALELNMASYRSDMKLVSSEIPQDKTPKFMSRWGRFMEEQRSAVTELFYGMYETKIKCFECEEESRSYEPFNSISLDLEGGEEARGHFEEEEDHQQLHSTRSIQLSSIIDNYTRCSSVDDGSSGGGYFCQKCQKNTSSSQSISFYEVPDVLIIHLKRFKFNPGLGVTEKVNTEIEYPATGLEIKDSKYDLHAVICHQGKCDEGHYYSYIKVRSHWYLCDDQRVLKPKTPIDGNAYILFYMRRTCDMEYTTQMTQSNFSLQLTEKLDREDSSSSSGKRSEKSAKSEMDNSSNANSISFCRSLNEGRFELKKIYEFKNEDSIQLQKDKIIEFQDEQKEPVVESELGEQVKSRILKSNHQSLTKINEIRFHTRSISNASKISDN